MLILIKSTFTLHRSFHDPSGVRMTLAFWFGDFRHTLLFVDVYRLFFIDNMQAVQGFYTSNYMILLSTKKRKLREKFNFRKTPRKCYTLSYSHTLLDGSNVRLNWNIESDMNVNWFKFKNFLSLYWFKNKQHWI